MKEVKIDKCPLCGGEEFIECKAGTVQGDVYLDRGMHNAKLYLVVCRDCGSVVRTYCKDPEKFYPKKERKI